MEGLIPMVFKAIKKNRIRRRYECLSSGAAETYNISDLYPLNNSNGQLNNNSPHVMYMTHSSGKLQESNGHHRRHKSVPDFYGYSSSPAANGVVVVGGGSPLHPSPPRAKQLVRFRSHRMFSCVTGAS